MLKKQEQKKDIVEQTSIPKTTWAFFWFVTKPFRWYAFGSVFFVTLGSSMVLATPYLLKLLVEAVEADDIQRAFRLGMIYPFIVLITQLLYRGSGVLAARWIVGLKKYSYDTLSRHVFSHSRTYFANRFAGSVLSKVTNVVGGLDQLIPDFLWGHYTAAISFLLSFVMIIRLDAKAGLTFLFLVVFLIVFNRTMAIRKRQYAKQVALANTAIRGGVVDTIANIQATRQFAHFNYEKKRIEHLSSDLSEKGLKSWFWTETTLAFNAVILCLFSLTMFGFLVEAWRINEVSSGDMVFAMILFSRIVHELMFIGRAMNRTAQTVGEVREGLDDLLLPYDIVDVSGAKDLVVSDAAIAWDGVGFEFEKQMVFADFDLEIPAGQKLGLVGHSGAGKSTFVSLLLREHELSAGQITIDGQNIAEITQNSLRENIAVVPQEPALFHRSVRENIAYGNPEATEEEIVAAAKQAQAHDFIIALPAGYDTLVGERGVKLSGGQKQRVAIARAMLKDAPILILDEATSALDSASEVSIQQALATLMEGKTVIAVAHRLSTLREMDRIIVLDQGKIVEDGTHNNLKDAGGTYADLWSHQAGGFLQDE